MKNKTTKTFPVVSISRCEDYNIENVNTALYRTVELLGGLKTIIKPKDRVLIKINLLAPTTPEQSVITHPIVVASLINLVKECGGIPWIGDSSGGPFLGLTSKAFEVSGYNTIAKETGAEIKNFETDEIVTIDIPNAKQIKTFQVARSIIEADVIISVAKCKIHELLLFTGAVKNLVGAIPGGGKKDLHSQASNAEKLAQAILDLYSVIRPHLSIMDAIIGLEGRKGSLVEGAGYGTPRKIGLILASRDAVALDAVTADIIGYNPMKIETVRLGDARGLGVGKVDKIKILGEELSNIRISNFLKTSNTVLETMPNFLRKYFIFQYITSELYINVKKCKRCGICEKSCPAVAINLKPVPVINKNTCIKCYCCHELCTNEAIVLKKPWMARYISKQVSEKPTY